MADPRATEQKCKPVCLPVLCAQLGRSFEKFYSTCRKAIEEGYRCG